LLSINALFASVFVIYAVSAIIKRIRKDIPILSLFMASCFMISYLWLLGGDISFADRNYGPNILHPLSRSLMMMVANGYTLRNLEIIVAVDKYDHIRSHNYRYLDAVAKYISYISVPANLLGFLLPTAIPSLPFNNTQITSSLCATVICAPPILFYAYELKQVVASIKMFRTFYDEIEAKMTRVFISLLIMTFIGVLFGIAMIFLPVFHNNMYIVYNIIIILGLISSVQILYLTSGETIQSPQIPRNQAMEKDTLVEMTVSRSVPRSGESSIESSPLQIQTRPTALSSTQEIEAVELNPSYQPIDTQNPDSSAHPLFNPFLAEDTSPNNNPPNSSHENSPTLNNDNNKSRELENVSIEISNQ